MKQGTGVTAIWRKALISVLVTACVLVAAPAFALGLGQIQVKSRAGQPLLAEIPIVSSDPSELDNLQARLASPETFARIGLEPPRGAVSNLVFTVALDARGNPVIRVTTSEPVEQPLLTFLVEVDWGQGRLVREYSALLDAPRTVSAPAQPAIDAAVTAPSNEIVRAPVAAPAPIAAESSPQASPAPTSTPASPPARTTAAPSAPPVPASQAAAEPAPVDDAIPAVPATPTPASKPAASPIAASPSGEITVADGDTLSSIVGAQEIEGHSREQAMLALLRSNPDAFIRGNLNLIKRGAVLRMPGADELSKYSAAEARLMVREQVSQWRQMRQPTPQPTAVAGDAATPPTRAPATALAPRDAAPRTTEARLEIVPRSADDARKAGTQSGIQAGGKGDMLQQQEMQETKETLAARDAEVQELKTRVADLEKLQQDQQKLIAMKDGELAVAQRNLAANQTAAATKPVEPSAAQPASTSAWPWWMAGVAIVLIAAWLLMRRRSSTPARPAFAPTAFANDSSALAAAMPAAPAATPETVEPKTPVASRPAWHVGGDDAATATTATTATTIPISEAAAADADAAPAPAPIADASPTSARPSTSPAAASSERLELARAYVDLGDDDTARTLLKEVADGDDASAREEAERLLRALG